MGDPLPSRDYATLERLYSDDSGAKWLRLTSDAGSMRERVSGPPVPSTGSQSNQHWLEPATVRGVQLVD